MDPANQNSAPAADSAPIPALQAPTGQSAPATPPPPPSTPEPTQPQPPAQPTSPQNPTQPAAPQPQQPVQPPAPATQPAPPAQPAPPTADEQNNQEWNAARDEIFPGLRAPNRGGNNESAQPAQGTQAAPAAPQNPANQTPNAQPGNGNDPGQQGAEAGKAGTEGNPQEGQEGEQPAAPAQNPPLSPREQQKQVEAVKEDIRSRMFGNVPTQLVGKEGEPIRGIDDLMQYINPRTGEPFTEEEAGRWLLINQNQLKDDLAAVERNIDRITNVNLDLKEQSDNILREFSEVFKANPQLQQQIWAEFSKTLVVDPDSKIIVNAPVSLENFYRTQLTPYAQAAQAQPPAAPPAQQPPAPDPAQAAEEARKAEAARQQNRSDRSDIYVPSGNTPDSQDDKEWGEAVATVFPHLTRKQ